MGVCVWVCAEIIRSFIANWILFAVRTNNNRIYVLFWYFMPVCVPVFVQKKTLIAPKRLGINRRKRANRFGVSMSVRANWEWYIGIAQKWTYRIRFSACNEWNSRETNGEKANQPFISIALDNQAAHCIFFFLRFFTCVCFLLNFSK